MKKIFINFFLDKSNNDDEITRYGLECLYILIEKTVILFSKSLLLGIFAELVVFIFFFSIIRSVAFGIHLDSSLKCTFFSIVAFLSFTYLSRFNLDPYMMIVLFSFSFIIIAINAPAESTRNVSRNKYRFLSLLLAAIYGFIAFYGKYYIPLFALVLESILVSKTVRRMKWSKC